MARASARGESTSAKPFNKQSSKSSPSHARVGRAFFCPRRVLE